MSKAKNRSIDNLRTRYRPTCNDITLERGLEVNAAGTSRDGDNIVNVSRAAAFKRYAYAGGSGAVARPYLHTAERKSRRPACGEAPPPMGVIPPTDPAFTVKMHYNYVGTTSQTINVAVNAAAQGTEAAIVTNTTACGYAVASSNYTWLNTITGQSIPAIAVRTTWIGDAALNGKNTHWGHTRLAIPYFKRVDDGSGGTTIEVSHYPFAHYTELTMLNLTQVLRDTQPGQTEPHVSQAANPPTAAFPHTVGDGVNDPLVITSSGHLLNTGNVITLTSNIAQANNGTLNPEANPEGAHIGTRTITKIDADHYSIDGEAHLDSSVVGPVTGLRIHGAGGNSLTEGTYPLYRTEAEANAATTAYTIQGRDIFAGDGTATPIIKNTHWDSLACDTAQGSRWPTDTQTYWQPNFVAGAVEGTNFWTGSDQGGLDFPGW